MDNTLTTYEATGYIINVLSIDFDIIMYPCIKLYNGHISGMDNPTNIWRFLENEYDIDKYLSYDAKTLSLIASLIKKNIKNGAKIVFLDEHHKIVDDLKSDPNFDTNLYNLVNVDWHHDIFYRKEDIALTKYFDDYDCSNWIGYLYKKNKLASCKWVKAPNSEVGNVFRPELGVINEEDIEKFSIADINIEHELQSVKDFDAQIIYLVKSPQWVPYKYQHLYNLLKEIFEPC